MIHTNCLYFKQHQQQRHGYCWEHSTANRPLQEVLWRARKPRDRLVIKSTVLVQVEGQ